MKELLEYRNLLKSKSISIYIRGINIIIITVLQFI